MDNSNQTGVEVKAGFFPLLFLLFLCTPRIEVDSALHKKYWGRHFFPLEPGEHTIKVYWRYLFLSHAGEATIKIILKPNQVSKVRYYMWVPWMFAKGSIKEV